MGAGRVCPPTPLKNVATGSPLGQGPSGAGSLLWPTKRAAPPSGGDARSSHSSLPVGCCAGRRSLPAGRGAGRRCRLAWRSTFFSESTAARGRAAASWAAEAGVGWAGRDAMQPLRLHKLSASGFTRVHTGQTQVATGVHLKGLPCVAVPVVAPRIPHVSTPKHATTPL